MTTIREKILLNAAIFNQGSDYATLIDDLEAIFNQRLAEKTNELQTKYDKLKKVFENELFFQYGDESPLIVKQLKAAAGL